MNRSGYSDDCEDNWNWICWRGSVKSAIRGKRGQAFLRELGAALDAMPKKELIAEQLEVSGEYCALGVIGHARGLDMTKIDVEDWERLGQAYGISERMAREIMYENDECVWRRASEPDQPERRWQLMRDWVQRNLVPPSSSDGEGQNG